MDGPMTTFAQRITSNDRIEVQPERLYEYFVTPHLLAKLTPLVKSIDVDDDHWTWQLVGVNALGINAAPCFTTIMDVDTDRIGFRPDPHADDRASATGTITVEADGPEHTVVAIDLTATVALPLPRMAAKGVQSVMFSTMKAGGSRFADNLLRELGNPYHRGLDVRGHEASLTP
jgi:uncharacterized protein YndB with AHSA1/START domain